MEREVTIKRVKSIKELREFVKECLIEHAEMRTQTMVCGNWNAYFYEQGWMDALRTIRDVISKDGLLLYRYKASARGERAEDKDRDTF